LTYFSTLKPKIVHTYNCMGIADNQTITWK
jgi:hypothetical protein